MSLYCMLYLNVCMTYIATLFTTSCDSNHPPYHKVVVISLMGPVFPSLAQEAPTMPQTYGKSSTYGQEFIVGFMQNIAASLLTELKVVVGTPVQSTQVVVESADEEFYRGTVTSDSPVVVDIPSSLDFQVADHTYSNRHKGIRISSTDNQTVYVLGMNHISSLNYATFLAYPCELNLDLGPMYEYLIMSIDHPTLNSQFLLVGCSADTQVTIIPTQNVLLPNDTQDLHSDNLLIQNGTMHSLSLNELDTLLVKSAGLDLTGTRVISNKPLTVISGHECAQVPQTSFDCEPLAVQIPPVSTWGTKFMVAGYAGRASEQLNFRVVPSEENTTLDATCGQSTLHLSRTSFQYAVSSDQPYCFFEFNKPVFLAQVASGRSTDNLGDPAISIISPIDQYINKIQFILLPTSEFPTSYVSITAPVEHYNPNSILLDGATVNCIWTAIYNSSNATVGYGCNVTMPAENDTTPSQHALSHSDPNGCLSATVYGFRSFPSQGYAYLTGQEIKITQVSESDIDECSIGSDNCDQVCINTVGSFNCSCNDGFTLNIDGATCKDIDECATNNGGCEQICINTVGSFHCSCNDGYSLDTDGTTCDDIDECTIGSDNCDQVCINIVGSFNCSCSDRFTLNIDGATCDDIDECAANNSGCEQICTNTVGSFNCSCDNGFTLNNDGLTCDDINECTIGSDNCDQVCINTVGSFNCSCNDGFVLNIDGATCDDIDECAVDTDDCDQVCINTVGSFDCSCYNGFSLSSNRVTCEDVDECATNSTVCGQICTNTVGSFNCSCNPGFFISFNERDCDDINECTIDSDNCDQVCINTVGSFNCSCNDGFSLNIDGATCDDIDECAANNSGCEQICTNTIGSFNCSCDNGFTLNNDGLNCDDINECTIGSDNCDQVCINTVGSFNCSCNDGFTLNINGATCDDIDECAANNSGCEQICTNTVGSFNCSCDNGFTLNNDGLNCDDELPTSIDFIDLMRFAGVTELPHEEDASSERIVLPYEILFGNQTVTVAYVNENGVISFNEPWKFSHPERFPTRNFNIRTKGVALAPFWSDIDIRRSGNIRYTTSTFPTTDHRELLEQFKINRYVGSVLLDGDLTFQGTWFLIAHWNNVHQSPHGADDHLGIPEEELNKTNDFQAIIVSNITSTFAIFNYICGELQWSGFGRNKALVGYIADGGTYINHPASGTSSIAEIISCSSEINKKRRKRQSEIDLSQFLAELPADPVQQRLGRSCVAHRERNKLSLLPFGITQENLEEISQTLDACPLNVDKAEQIVGRFVRFTDNPPCYISGGPITRFGTPFTFTQQCCYDFGSGDLVTDRLEGYAGTMLLYHPLIDPDEYNLYDEMYREACCTPELVLDTLCREYFEIRPINQGDEIAAPAVGVGLGRDDPLYHTLDNKVYLFMGIGDFVTMDALDDDNNVVFSLQSRLNVLGNWATWTKVLAFGEPGTMTFEIGVTENSLTVMQLAPSEEPIIEDDLEFEQIYYYPDPDRPQSFVQKIIYESNVEGLLFYFFQSKIAIRLRSVHRPYGDYINWNILVPQEYERRTRGLLGYLDGDRTNDFRRRDGTEFPQPHFRIPDNSATFNIIVEEWSVMDAESIFKDVNAGRKKRQITNSLAQNFPEGFNFTVEQTSMCEGDLGCLYHLVVIDDQQVANNVLVGEHIINATLDTLANSAPNISGSGVFRVNLQEESVYTFQVVDPGDNFTLSIQGGQPPDSLIAENDDGLYELRWNLQSITNTPLVIVATDTRNVSSTHSPRVEVCGCVNDGVCTLEGVITTNTTITMICLCDEAFSGQFCEEDRNGCGEIQCYEGVECLDIPAPGTGAVCGSCPLGFTGDGLKCYDIDECELNKTECEQLCINTEGSYQCDCIDGYQLLGSTQCEDLDECTENLHDCEQVCDNTVGSYNCSCEPGFTLASDGRNCTANQPCDNGGGCSHICAVVNGAAQCFCPLGFQLPTPGGTDCEDINECLNSTCDQTCLNTNGSFKCMCSEGYTLIRNERTCEDIDECLEAALDTVDLCENDQNAQCLNTEGSFKCVCVPGFERHNGTCQVIEEEPPPLPPVATPPNGLESSVSFHSPTLNISDFTPERQQRFREVTASAVVGLCMNATCTVVIANGDMEERYNLQPRPQNVAIPTGIINQLDSGELNITFYVQFSDGSILNVENLTTAVKNNVEEYRHARFLPDIDECSTNNGGCEQVCINIIGSFYCDCNDGFTLNSNGTTCDDTNECSIGNGGCEHMCNNTVGSFNCSCYSGYVLSADGVSCNDLNECSTNNGGCDHICANTIGSYNCSCNDGFSLNLDNITCSDINECTIGSDNCHQVCINTVGSFNCSCNDGFSLNIDRMNCNDIDECATNNGGCEHSCLNTVGSYNCSCNNGFTLSNDEANCDDIDECTIGSDNCHQVCINTVGSFNCSCSDGFVLNIDGATCDDVNECATNNGGCEHSCLNTVGSYNCSCNNGFTLSNDEANCDDIDECTIGSDNCHQVCINTVGSFNCSCNDGFILNIDGATCDDIDECATNNGGCEQICSNTVGSFNCSCNDGYSLDTDGTTCDDIDECTIGSNNCHQVCINSGGSYTCSCNDGFYLNLDNTTCDDIDECAANNSGCGQICTNTVGSFNCSCDNSFTLNNDGLNCDDIDECTEDSNNCEQICTNTVGSFNCSCIGGFVLNVDGATCDDIDECAIDTDDCDQVCINTVGSFDCSCYHGFSLSSNRVTCEDMDECATNSSVCGQICTNTVGSFNCSCDSGFSLSSNERDCDDFNECSISNGGCEHMCNNTVGSFNCSCYSGYVLSADGVSCNDIDECTIGSDNNCDQVCINTVGSFNCSCNDGFVLNIDGATCDDINECTIGSDNCHQMCVNSVGSYTCSCNDGFYLNLDNTTCDDIDECSIGSDNCDQVCINTVGSFNCSCNDGFTLNIDGTTCDDINECTIGSDNCHQMCVNSVGSYTCSCNDGFYLNLDNTTCDDIDECTIGSDNCDQVCINTVGSFNCSCNDGFTLNIDGTTCDDVNECVSNNGGCEHSCVNTVGSYNCSCNNGFILSNDEANCDDIDECTIGSDNCDQVCINTVGSFNCSCNDGFSLNIDGTTCDDVDECHGGNVGCEQFCTNTIGSYICSCYNGFSLHSDGATCIDINECNTGGDNCDQICINTVGSFNCSCNDGFSLNANGTTCDDVDECSTNNGGCEHECNNTIGSFHCSCNRGFSLNADRTSCDDIDECSSDNGGCEQICTNTVGSFNCSCRNGYFLNSNGAICDESPGPPVDVMTFDSGAQWIVLSWTSTFDGSRPVTAFNIYIQNVNKTENFDFLIQLDPRTLSSNSGSFMYNISDQSVVFPFTLYSFRMDACNVIGCSNQSDSSMVIMTDQDSPSAAPNITEVISPSSTSIYLSWDPPPPELRRGILIDYRITYYIENSAPIVQTTTDTSITLDSLTIFETYLVNVSAGTSVGYGPEDNTVIKTLNDTAEMPTNLQVTSRTDTTITLTWNCTDACKSNGDTTHFEFTYSGRKSYDPDFSEPELTLQTAVDELQTGLGATLLQDTLMNLTPGTEYTITVAAVNGAGVGDRSDSVVGITITAPPPPPDPIPPDPPTMLVPDNVRTETIFLPLFSDVNGPISHYHVFVVLLPADVDVGSLLPPEEQFPNININNDFYQLTFCDEKPTVPTVYITTEFGADLFPPNNLFIVGNMDPTNHQSPNDQTNTYTNGELCHSGKYTFFTRAYTDMSINQRAKRQTDRQYTQHQTSDYNPVVIVGLLPSPTQLTVTSVTSRSVVISWQIDTSTIPITGYTVEIMASATGQVVFSDDNLPPNTLTLTLRDLQPTTDYQVLINAHVNAASSGEQVSTQFRTIANVAFFQLRLQLSGIGRSCNDWVAIDLETLQGTTDEVASEIVTNVEERCQCGFTQSNITSDGFRCFPESTDAVTYRGKIHETDTASVFDLIRHIEDWTADGVSILVQSVFVEIDSSCKVAIESFSEKECLPQSITTNPTLEGTQTAGNMAIIGGAAAGVVIVLILIVAIVAVITVIIVLKSHKAQYKLEAKTTSLGDYDVINITAIEREREERSADLEYEIMEMVSLSHDYETLDNYNREYENIDTQSIGRQLSGANDITTCEAYYNFGTEVNKSTLTESDHYDVTQCPAYATTALTQTEQIEDSKSTPQVSETSVKVDETDTEFQ